MGWECPHLFWFKEGTTLTNICRLNKQACSPAQGKCILRGKVKIASLSTEEEESKR